MPIPQARPEDFLPGGRSYNPQNHERRDSGVSTAAPQDARELGATLETPRQRGSDQTDEQLEARYQSALAQAHADDTQQVQDLFDARARYLAARDQLDLEAALSASAANPRQTSSDRSSEQDEAHVQRLLAQADTYDAQQEQAAFDERARYLAARDALDFAAALSASAANPRQSTAAVPREQNEARFQSHLEPFADQFAEVDAAAARLYGGAFHAAGSWTERDTDVDSLFVEALNPTDAITVVENVEPLLEFEPDDWNTPTTPQPGTPEPELPPPQPSTPEPESPPALTIRLTTEVITSASTPPYERTLDLRIPLHFADPGNTTFLSMSQNLVGPLKEAFDAACRDLNDDALHLEIGGTRVEWPFQYTSPPYFRVILNLDEVGPGYWREVDESVMESLYRHFGEIEGFEEVVVRYFACHRSGAAQDTHVV